MTCYVVLWHVLIWFSDFEQADLSDFSGIEEDDAGGRIPCEVIQDESNTWWLVHGHDRIQLPKPCADGGGLWFVESNENNDWVVGDGKRAKIAKNLIAARMRLLVWSINLTTVLVFLHMFMIVYDSMHEKSIEIKFAIICSH